MTCHYDALGTLCMRGEVAECWTPEVSGRAGEMECLSSCLFREWRQGLGIAVTTASVNALRS